MQRSLKLVADVGGTNVRFALTDGASLQGHAAYACADHSSLIGAIQTYLAQTGAAPPTSAAIAIASAVADDWVAMTNHSWAFSIEQTRRALGLQSLVVLNDFTALALSLPHLAPGNLQKIGGGEAITRKPIALIGPGTGLGVSGLLPSGDGWTAIEGEGGHCSFSPANQREADILRIAWRSFTHVSSERLISGIGFENLYRAIAELDRLPAHTLSPEQITERALAGADQLCIRTLETFCAMLGTAASNLALTLGARGGVYVGGGIVPKLGDFFAHSSFRARFEAKGRRSGYLAAIPTYVILAEHSALIGAAQALAAEP